MQENIAETSSGQVQAPAIPLAKDNERKLNRPAELLDEDLGRTSWEHLRQRYQQRSILDNTPQAYLDYTKKICEQAMDNAAKKVTDMCEQAMDNAAKKVSDMVDSLNKPGDLLGDMQKSIKRHINMLDDYATPIKKETEKAIRNLFSYFKKQ